MAVMSVSEEDAKLASQCLDLCQTLAGKSLAFSFSLTIGSSFSFSVDTRGKEVLVPQRKKKTPSTLRRNARRREELLKKKLNASTAISPQSEQASTKEAEVLRKAPPVLHHHPSPSASSKRGHVVVVGREKAMLSFNQLDGSASPSSPAHRPPPPPLTSCTASTQTWFGSTNKFCMAKTHSMYSGPELK